MKACARTRKIAIGFVILVVALSLYLLLLHRQEPAQQDRAVTSERGTSDASLPPANAQKGPTVSEKPVPSVAPGTHDEESQSDSRSLELSEALESIRQAEVARFRERLLEGDIPILEMRYWSEWLKICLSEETAREAFKDWLFERVRRRPDDVKYLQEAMQSLSQAAPDMIEEVVDRAIREENWLLLGSCLGRLNGDDHSIEWMTNVIEKALASNNGIAQFYAVWRLQRDAEESYSAEIGAELLEDAFYYGSDDIGAEAMIMLALGERGLLNSDASFETLVDNYLGSTDPARRRLGYTGLILSVALYWSGNQRELLGKRLATLTEYMAHALQDPDPLVRLSASIDYLAFQDELDSIMAYLSATEGRRLR